MEDMENTIKSSEYDFTIRRGESDIHQLLNWTVNDTPFMLDDADEVRVDFRMNPRQCTPPDLTLTVANGGLVVYENNLDMVFAGNTLVMHPGVYYYDVLVVKAGARHNWVRGKMIVENIMTR